MTLAKAIPNPIFTVSIQLNIVSSLFAEPFDPRPDRPNNHRHAGRGSDHHPSPLIKTINLLFQLFNLIENGFLILANIHHFFAEAEDGLLSNPCHSARFKGIHLLFGQV